MKFTYLRIRFSWCLMSSMEKTLLNLTSLADFFFSPLGTLSEDEETEDLPEDEETEDLDFMIPKILKMKQTVRILLIY